MSFIKMVSVPKVLKKEWINFYLIGSNSKLPVEKAWTRINNYKYNHPKLKAWNGNYGILCGEGGLIVIDFDSQDYYDKIKDKLPPTFIVITAGKRLPHYYYRVKELEEIKIKKIPIDNYEGKRVCDIQMYGSGVVGPNSKINRRYYEPNNREIAEISFNELKKIFNINKIEEVKECQGNYPKNNDKVKVTYNVMKAIGVKRTNKNNFKCPFHDMHGSGNLSITDSGKIYCFHEQKSWWIDEFVAEYYKITLSKAKEVIEFIKVMVEDIKRGQKV